MAMLQNGVVTLVGVGLMLLAPLAHAGPQQLLPAPQRVLDVHAFSERCLTDAPSVIATYKTDTDVVNKTSGSLAYLGGDCSSFIAEYRVTPTAPAHINLHGEDAWQDGPVVTYVTQAQCETVSFASSVYKLEGGTFHKKWSRTQKGVWTTQTVGGSTHSSCKIEDVGAGTFGFDASRPTTGTDTYRILVKSVRQGASREVRAQARKES